MRTPLDEQYPFRMLTEVHCGIGITDNLVEQLGNIPLERCSVVVDRNVNDFAQVQWDETMIIDKNISDYIVFVEDNIANALHKIDRNNKRFIFAVNQSGVIEGVLTDGDFRRWALLNNGISLSEKVDSVINKSRNFRALQPI
jgi:hypothetical protein